VGVDPASLQTEPIGRGARITFPAKRGNFTRFNRRRRPQYSVCADRDSRSIRVRDLCGMRRKPGVERRQKVYFL